MEYSFYVAGMKFHKYPRVKHLIKEGDEVLLVPDPENKFDPHAVKIVYPVNDELIMLGHVPMKKDLSLKISSHIVTDTNKSDHFLPYHIGTVTYHGLDSPSYQALKVKVTFNG